MKKSGQTESPKDLLASLGGWIGIVESLVPGTVYVTLFSLTLNVLLSASVAGAVALVFAVYQLVRKRPLTQVFAGLAGLGLSIWLPLRDGLSNTHAADYFLPGILTNIGYATVFALSLIFRFPLAGVVVGYLKGTSKSWRGNQKIYRRYFWISVLWLTMFLVRLAIQLPFYFAGEVAALGVSKLVLGTPFYALVVWFSWLLARVNSDEIK